MQVDQLLCVPLNLRGAGKKKGVVRAGEIGDCSVNRNVRVERESA
jgi:hypothetical protein